VRAHTEDRLALDLESTVRHRDRRLFVTARDPFGLRILAVVDERFLQPRKLEPGLAKISRSEALEDIDHEVGTRAVGRVYVLTRGGAAVFQARLAARSLAVLQDAPFSACVRAPAMPG